MDTERLARRRKNIDGLDWETTYEMVLGIVTRLDGSKFWKGIIDIANRTR
jgi:hypothetical protein